MKLSTQTIVAARIVQKRGRLMGMIVCIAVAISSLAAHRSFAAETERPALDLSPFALKLVYATDFSQPLSVVREADLVQGNKRISQPIDVDWVLEGPGRAWAEGGRLCVSNGPIQSAQQVREYATVLWNTRVFPEDFLLEFAISPEDSTRGLAIIFFSAVARDGGSIFDAGVPLRRGRFAEYVNGAIDTYHSSYWATYASSLEPRGRSHLRKDPGFNLVAAGDDHIWGQGPGPHRVRLMKVDGQITLETRGKVALRWQDMGEALGAGRMGLQTMLHTRQGAYPYFKVWEVLPK
jgi:Domain of unknown function (DUF1961)